MVVKIEGQAKRLDGLKWLTAFFLLCAGVVGNYYYSEISILLRMLVWLFVLALSAFIVSSTQKGKWAVDFFRDSRMELRKVVWPTREETVQTTLVVIAMVIVLALLLWAIDGFLVWVIGWLTGQRG